MAQKHTRKVQTEEAPEGSSHNLRRFALFFFDRPWLVAVAMTVLVLFGILSYTTLMRREGFPSINVPYASLQGVYFGKDAADVDAEVAKPLASFLARQPSIKSVNLQSGQSFFGGFIEYSENTDAAAETSRLQKQLAAEKVLPAAASAKFDPAKFGFTMRGDDAVVSFINTRQPTQSAEQLSAQAQKAVAYFKEKQLNLVKSVSIIDQFAAATNPLTGEAIQAQQSFERYGEGSGRGVEFYRAVIIGFSKVQGADTLEFDSQLQKAVADYNASQGESGYSARLSASYGPGIRQQITELQRTLLEGLLAVLLVGGIIIALRASLITVLSMLMVLAVSLGILNVMGHTLNTIVLFALILGLSLIVDDTIIMVEAIDAQRRRKNTAREVIAAASGKVGRAMLAATLTAALSFAPLLFIGGIIGDFVKEVPITIITALLTSLVLALVAIPLLARFIMLSPKQLGKKAKAETSAKVEASIARGLSAPMLWARHSRKKLVAVCVAAVAVSLGFVMAAGMLFAHVPFNIFPPSKDANEIQLQVNFTDDPSLSEVESLTDKVNLAVAKVIGPEFVRSANFGQASAQGVWTEIFLTDYNKRDVTAQELVKRLKTTLARIPGIQAQASVVDVGPPATDLSVQIAADKDREGALKLAHDIEVYLQKANIERLDKSRVTFEKIAVSSAAEYPRNKEGSYIAVNGKFNGTDTSTMLTLVQNALKKEFPASRVAGYGLPKDALKLDLGQEQGNQDSFKTMMIAFPLVLLAIYLLLAVQFRSLLQPLLIFLAIPFSLLGVTFGLWVTHNAFSFFAMLGFFALIGLSIKNTILLTDYANQARRAGMNPVDAAHEALAERFRPLIATSLTAMFSLIPLAIASPFWQGLTVVLIFGLLSSTFLVVTVFPYYYLIGEFLRGFWRRRVGRPLRRRLQGS